jgi:antitoxin PrlF
MTTATVTSKGQITIPVSVRTALGIETGSRVEFIQTGANEFSLIPATQSVKQLKGILAKPQKPVSIEDMNNAIATQGASAK